MFQLNLKSRRSLSALVLSTVAALTLTTACTVHDTDNYGYNNPPPTGHKAPPRGHKPHPAQPPQHQGQRPAQPPRPARDGRYDSLISSPGQEYNGYPNRPAQPPR